MKRGQGFNPQIRRGGNRTMSGWDDNPIPERPMTPSRKRKIRAKKKRAASLVGGAPIGGGAAVGGAG